MVEANMDPEGYDEMEEQKTFLDEPAILDKFKAAAVITDGKFYSIPQSTGPLNRCFFSLPCQGD
jgi:hypothetical protein